MVAFTALAACAWHRREELRRQPHPRLGGTEPARACMSPGSSLRIGLPGRAAAASPELSQPNGAGSSIATASSRSATSCPRYPSGAFATRCSTPSSTAVQQQQGDAITRRVTIGPEHSAPACRSLRDLLASQVAGVRSSPTSRARAPSRFITSRPSLSGVAPGGPDPQLELHADTFHPSLKAWLFLTDVTDDQAPLTYVPGSHRLTPERLAWEQARSVSIVTSDRLSQRGSLRIAPEELPALGLPATAALRSPRQHPRRYRHLRLPCAGKRRRPARSR